MILIKLFRKVQKNGQGNTIFSSGSRAYMWLPIFMHL